MESLLRNKDISLGDINIRNITDLSRLFYIKVLWRYIQLGCFKCAGKIEDMYDIFYGLLFTYPLEWYVEK